MIEPAQFHVDAAVTYEHIRWEKLMKRLLQEQKHLKLLLTVCGSTDMKLISGM